ncbi:amino acid adenylation domain-containing protein [Lentzea sp. NPDC004789]
MRGNTTEPVLGSLCDALTFHAGHHPGREALTDGDTRTWTYGQLRDHVVAVANALARNGVRRGSRVAVMGGRTADTVAALLAVLHAGGAYCVLDPDLPRARQELVLADLAPDAVLVTAGGWDGGGAAPVVSSAEPGPAGDVEATPDATGDDLAYVMYTSGSTGRPKGVLVEHGSVLNMLRSYDVLAPPRERLVGSLVAPCGFDVSVWEIFSVLARGGTLCVPATAHLRDGAALWRFLADSGVTSAYVPPGLLPSLVDAAERDRAGRSALDRVLVGVEPIPLGLLDRFRAAVPGLRVVNGYGPTEATITATLHLLGPVHDPARRTPIGRPVLGSAVVLVDERLEPVPEGEPGEVVVLGSCLARGYHRAQNGGFGEFRGRRAYFTGDHARLLPDGSLEFVGRRDGQVKVNGFRVETGEVEAALAELPGVRRSLVLTTGAAGAVRLIAAVEGDARPEAVREHLTNVLPPHMIPSRVLVVPGFPLTANGKVDNAALLALDRQRPADAPAPAPASTAGQQRVADVWAEVLGVAEVGLDDDFHWLGGTSLDAVRIATRLTSADRAVSAAAVLSARTVRALLATDHGLAASASAPARPGTHPASRAHEGLWAWRELMPEDASTTVVHAFRLPGDVDPDRLRRAMAAVIARHEAMRTTFHGTDTGVVQRVSAPGRFDLPVSRISGESEVDARLRELVGRRLDVSVRPWTAELLLGGHFGALVLAADHLVFDGESAVILEHDLALAYEGRLTGPPVAGPASEGALATPEPRRAAELGAYWRNALDGLVDAPALPEPIERTPPAAGRGRLGRNLPEPTWTAVKALARQARTTPFVVMLAALKAFRRRRGAPAHDVVSIAVSRRQAVACPDAIGHFVNLVPVADHLTPADEEQPFRRYLTKIAELVRDCVAHGDLPFEDLVGMPRPTAVTSYARVVLAQRAAPPEPAGPSAVVREWPRIPFNALHDLTVFLTEDSDARRARLDWVWDVAKALPGTAERTAEAFDAFLAAVVLHPDDAPAQAPALTTDEVDLTAANTAAVARSARPTLVELFERQVLARPDAVAVQRGARLVTYAELAERAAEIQARLPVSLGRDDPVAVVLDKSVDLLAALLAVVRAGAAYLPVAPEHAATRLSGLIRRAGVAVCVTTSGLVSPEALGGASAVLIDTPPDETGRTGTPAAVSADDLAYVMPTSGSTGVPKLVGVPHRAVSRLVHDNRDLPLGREDRTMLVANSSFDAATFEIWGALANGGRVVVPAPEELRQPELLCAAVERYGVTAGFFTVTLFERLVEAAPARLAGMKHLVVGGEAVPPRLFLEASRHVRRDALVNGYGPTENTTFSCCYRLDRDPAGLRSVPIGRPISGSGALVVNDSLRPAPPGVPGEILVCGDGLARGYLNDPDLTAERFVAVEALNGRIAYRTGDRGRVLPDGNLEYLGRSDRQLKVRGFRVELGEVEAALDAHPAVRRAAAYARRVSGLLSLRAAVEAAGVDGAALRSWLAGRVPDYLVPDRVTVVDEFPMTANGKLDEAALDAGPDADDVPSAEPRTAIERTLTGLWAELLGLRRVGPDDDVFALGANSMTVLAMAARLRRDLSLDVPVHVLYSVRTARGLAQQARTTDAGVDPELRQRLQRRAGLMRKAARAPRRSPHDQS